MVQQLFSEGDLVFYVPDPERRVYRVKGNPTFQNGDYWYSFHKTGQGGTGRTEPKLPQAGLVHANTVGNIWGTPGIFPIPQ